MKTLLIFPVFLFWIVTAKAQTEHIQNKGSLTEFTFWGGYSFQSVKLVGKTPDAQTSIVGIGLKTPIRYYDNGNILFYTADIIPMVEFHYPKRDDNGKRTVSSGWGISPVGFQLLHQTHKIFNPYVQVTGGFMQMEHIFPTGEGKKLNFTFDITLGSDISLFNRNILTLGYKFHHISNGQTGNENPGLDSNFLFASFSF